MSASTRLVRNAAQSSFLTGARAFPRSGPSSAYTAFLRRNTRTMPSQMPALAILIPRRGVQTDTHTTGAPSSGPPPGFNPDQAKRPLSDDPKAPTKETVANMAEKHDVEPVPNNQATAVPKTDAVEALTLSELAGKKDKSVETTDGKKADKKLTIGQKIKKEAQHYWDGTKLLATEVRISTRLALKMAAGYELSRREHRQLQRTVQDIGRLVPFSVFVLVPFAELLLPVALKLFPNLLPSTYEAQKSKDNKAASLRGTRKDVSNFLRNTLKETGLPLSPSNAQKDEFLKFFRKVRSTGEQPTPNDVINVCKIFKDDLTLDNLSRPQLVGMCRYMNLNTFGTDMMLRYQIRHRMRQIKRDDRAISYEGVDSLSVPELQVAAQSRGIRTHGVSPARLRDDLQLWLDLRLKNGVPSTLLVLSNAFMYAQGKESEFSTQIDALTGVLSSIPEELFHEIELEVHNAEGAATNKQRLEVLREQQELIEEENEQDEENKESGRATPRDDEDIDEKEERRLEAESTAAGKEQASEAIEAEKEGVEVQRKEVAAADEKKSS
ncbi:LETM1 domain-containing protein mdm28, mitochondrial [Lachnellula hyalina]|uniref:LETM1 domain-containing protein mdm28, mitochondrial n=1 Tax=Lachnellula hyalina TaxID=1316788 RepID=A0A8H8TZZ2_9HELO|nr:LETM1 domain-containing protein mdm28, mitochondrial [Lachnellula hyalina]TVY28347.1 LETM1 domain-containing protein mdm28, mitochondrial [Lachnellula hyalina]